MEEKNKTILETNCILEADTIIDIAKNTIMDRKYLNKKHVQD